MVNPEDFPASEGLLLLKLPAECLTAIISGVRSSGEQRNEIRRLAQLFDCPDYEMRLGRSSCVPFFIDQDRSVFVFNDIELAPAECVCVECAEPSTNLKGELCDWCAIDEGSEGLAWQSNPFTLMDRLGLREQSGYGFSFYGLVPVGKKVQKQAPD